MATTQVAVNDIWVCKDQRCAGQCDDKVGLCQYLIYGCDAPDPTFTADLAHTADGGATWTNSVDYPFANGENIMSVGCFALDNTVTRWLAVRGAEVAPANPLEIAYSDDGGASWTNVDVEAAGTRYATDSGALFVLNSKNIWLASSGGYIFFSSDGGITWTQQEDGTVTAGNYNAIMFANENDGFAVADTGIVVRTVDGGLSWTAVTAITAVPNVLCVYVFNKDEALVGTATGEIWRTWDGGTTWTQVYTSADSINDIDFANKYVGFAIADDTVLRTRNGGEDWETVSGTTVTTELNAVVACDENTAYAVGEDAVGVGIVIKIS
ncbi:MAG: YCF48-related protein [Candidatus Paceibacterota bacterium]